MQPFRYTLSIETNSFTDACCGLSFGCTHDQANLLEVLQYPLLPKGKPSFLTSFVSISRDANSRLRSVRSGTTSGSRRQTVRIYYALSIRQKASRTPRSLSWSRKMNAAFDLPQKSSATAVLTTWSSSRFPSMAEHWEKRSATPYGTLGAVNAPLSLPTLRSRQDRSNAVN